MKKKILGVSLITVSCLYGLLLALVFLICLFLNVEMTFVLLLSIILLVIQFLVAPFFTDLSMKWFYKANFEHKIPDYLDKFIKDICSANDMKYPRIGYIDDGAPNAFTYGRTKNDARIVLTRGIFDLLSEEEVKAVVAHEIGHAVHYDMMFMTVVQLVPLVLYYVFEVCTSSDSSSDNDNGALGVIGIIAYVLYVISQYIILWLSRVREYYADSFSVDSTRNPNALAEALVKIGYGLSASSDKKGRMSASKSNALGIFDSKTSKSLIVTSYDDGFVSKDNIKNAMKWEKWNLWAKWYELNSTHPLISKRLIAISERANEFGQIPYIKFDLIKSESYLDDFIGELFIKFMPTIVIIIGIVLLIIAGVTENAMIANMICFIPFLFFFTIYFSYQYSHKNRDFKLTNVSNLLSEVKVSGVTTIPCTLEGNIIGKGDPGCIFNEDFILRDDSGIIFLDYRRVIGFMNWFDGLFRNQKLIEKKIKVTGWYKRSPVPYIEILTMEVEGEGKVRKFKSYYFTKFILIAFTLISLIFGVSIFVSLLSAI